MDNVKAFFLKVAAFFAAILAFFFGGRTPEEPTVPTESTTVIESTTEPTTEPATEPITEPITDPVTEPETRLVMDSREVIGSGGYGAVFNAQIDPFDENCYGFTCDMGSVYFSYNKGQSFERINLKGTIFDMRFDPTTEGVVWAVGSGVYKSTDHGRSFSMVFPKAADVYSQGRNYENGNWWIFAKDENNVPSDYIPQFQAWSMAINRNSGGKNVYIAQRVSSYSAEQRGIYIYETLDGENFHFFKKMEYCENYKLDYDEVNDCLIYIASKYSDPGYGKIYEIDRNADVAYIYDGSVKIHHTSGNTMAFSSCYDKEKNLNTFCFSIVTEDGEGKRTVNCYKTNDLRDPDSYINLTEKLYSLKLKDIVKNPSYLYRADWSSTGEVGDYASNEYYEWLSDGVVKQTFVWDIENVSVLSDDVIYLYQETYVKVLHKDGTVALDGRRVLGYIKYDGTKEENKQFNWVFGLPHKATNMEVNTSWQDGDSGFCFGFSSSPTNEDALVFGTAVGIYSTTDGEDIYQHHSAIPEKNITLTAKNSKGQTVDITGISSCKTTGVDVYVTHKIATDPFDSNHILMGCTDFGMLQSFDGGNSWIRLLRGWNDNGTVSYTDPSYRNTCYDLVFDKDNRDIVYSVWSNVQYAPYAPGSGYLTAKGRFAISFDGGTSWEYISMRQDNNVIPYRILVEYEGDNRVIYVATANRGFYVSHDGGRNFEEFNNGIETAKLGGQDAIYGQELIKTEAGTYAIVSGAGTSVDTAGFYKYNEVEKLFEKIPLPKYVSGLRDIEYDKNNDCFYIAAVATSVDNSYSMYKKGGGVWKYKDGEFTQIFDETLTVSGVNCDSEGRLYATVLSGKVIAFDDNNTTYRVLADDLFHMLKYISFSPDNMTLYVSSWGGATEKITLKSVEVEKP